MTSSDELLAAGGQWGGSDRMNELEATMWRSERHPQQSSTICTLSILDRAPDWDRFVTAHEWATRLVARSRQRVVEPLLPTGPPVWAADPHFSMAYHLRRMQLGPRNSTADLLALAQSLAMAPFDRTRPLWEGVLVEGLEGDRAAYFLKLHHSLTDGLGTIQLMSLVQSRRREHTHGKPVGPPLAVDEPDRMELTVRGVLESAGRSPELLRTALGLGRRAVAHPSTVVSDGLRFGASLRRVLTPPAAPSPLFRNRDGRLWLLRTLECSLADLKAAGKAGGGSVNDAYVAALLGGLRRYHERHGLQIDELPITVPVSLRRADDPMGGNKFAGAMFAAPVGIADPAERIAALRGAILSQLSEPALDTFSMMTPIVNRLPSEVGARIVRVGSTTDLSASNIPGLAEPVYMAGARVERVFPFGPLPGVAVMAAMMSHVGTCCIGLTIDGSAVPDVDDLMECLEAGLAEVVGLAAH